MASHWPEDERSSKETLARQGNGKRAWLAGSVALAALFLLLAMPSHPEGLRLSTFAEFPLELAGIALLLGLVPRRGALSLALRSAATILAGLLILVKVADLGFYSSLSRPFNPAYDMPLFHAGWMLLSGSKGVAFAAMAACALGLAFAAVVAIIWWATGVLAGSIRSGRVLVPLGLAGLVAAGLAASNVTAGSGFSTASWRLASDHVAAVIAARADVAALTREAAVDDAQAAPGATALAGLRGRDVLFMFVESYGRSSLDDPRYAPTTDAVLATIEGDLARRGLAMRSAWMTSPTMGGQSWLAHASLMSGLWIDSQGRYLALLESKRPSLLRVAAQNGWRSVAVMPALTMAWPDADYFGYDRVYAKNDLGYRGLPFNWVTMPDQYTLAAFERAELDPARESPIVAEIALISSHAPWTPIPDVVPWEDVGDGTIFNAQALAGDPPEVVWRDPDRIRDQFRKSIDYALRTIGSFAARHSAQAPLIIVLGDHQPAPLVSGGTLNRDVPIHIIGAPQVLSRLDGWNFTKGLKPGPDAPVWRMDSFRKRFLDAFSSPAPPGERKGEHA